MKNSTQRGYYIFPAVEKYDPSVDDAFDQEHAKDHFLGQLLAEAISLYKNVGIIIEKSEAGKQGHAAFLKFMLFNIEHTVKEEDVLNPILWRYYTDAELKGISQQIITNIPQDYMT